MPLLKRRIDKSIRLMFPENNPDRIQYVLQRLRDNNDKDPSVPGSLTWLGRCVVDNAAADIIEQLVTERDVLMRYADGRCETCALLDDCYKHDGDPNGPYVRWYEDCEDWQWRGVQKEA